jgi:hypothetical protein
MTLKGGYPQLGFLLFPMFPVSEESSGNAGPRQPEAE